MSDLISRQVAIDALGNAHFKNYGNAIMVIQALPSTEPVRHGKWECTYSPNGFLLEQKCSECGLTFEEPSGVDYNYCPHCGARMDAERKE